MPGFTQGQDPGGTFSGNAPQDPSGNSFGTLPGQDVGGVGYWYNQGNHNSARPNPPKNFTVTLLQDNVTIQLSVQADGFSVQNNYWTGLEVRFYFTPATASDIAGLTTPQADAASFARSHLIANATISTSGGQTTVLVDGAILGLGVFWATVVATYATFGSLESHPAGPAFLASGDFQRTLDYVQPDDVTNVNAELTLVRIPGSTLLYANINFTYTVSDSFSFDGVTPWFSGYFANKPGWPGNLEEGPFFKYRPDVNNGICNLTLEADYDTSSSTWLNTPHGVVMYVSAVSRGRTYKLPINSRPTFTFTNGIGG